MTDKFVTIAKADDVPIGEARVVEVSGQRVALCNVDGTFYAVADTCSHDNGPLGAGKLDGCAIICPRHGAKFDVRDGSVLQMPAAYPVRSYTTRLDNGNVQIDMGETD